MQQAPRSANHMELQPPAIPAAEFRTIWKGQLEGTPKAGVSVLAGKERIA